MNIVLLMIPLALILGGAFVAAFWYALEQSQFDDLETPAHRILLDEIDDRQERTVHEH